MNVVKQMIATAVVLGVGIFNGTPASDASMQAVVVRDGEASVQSVAMPVAAGGEVLVRVHAIGVNPVDWRMAQRRAEGPPPGAAPAPTAGPSIPGFDAAGTVEAVGAGVTDYHVGDAVIVWSKARGTYAQYVAVPADTIAFKPAALSFEQAAGIGHASFTAWNMLIDVAHIQAAQRVLVIGASGGVGSTAVQIAHNMGAHAIAVASAGNRDYVRGLGAEEFIDYKTEAFESRLKNLDIVINTVDADNARRAVGTLRRGGYLVSLIGLPTDECVAAGISCSSRTMTGSRIGDVLKQLAAWAQHGKFTVYVDRTFALEEAAQAWEYSQAGHTRGKTVIRLLK